MQEKIDLNSFSESVLYQTIRKLYYISQLCGYATFSHSPTTGLYMKPINYIIFTINTIVLWSLFLINVTQELTVPAVGYKAILLYIGIHLFMYSNIIFVWNGTALSFACRQWLCQLLKDMVKLECTVR